MCEWTIRRFIFFFHCCEVYYIFIYIYEHIRLKIIQYVCKTLCRSCFEIFFLLFGHVQNVLDPITLYRFDARGTKCIIDIHKICVCVIVNNEFTFNSYNVILYFCKIISNFTVNNFNKTINT